TVQFFIFHPSQPDIFIAVNIAVVELNVCYYKKYRFPGVCKLEDFEQQSAFPSNTQVLVLLVDDQPIVGEAVRRALAHQADINFHYCAEPAEAIAVAERIRPTVILQDLVMPGVDGLDLVREYRRNPLTKDIPIIVLSSNDDPLVKSEAFTAGAND